MIQIFVVAEIIFLIWVIHILIRRNGKTGAPERPVSIEAVLSRVESFGKNSNSFMTLYPGFEYFQRFEGIIAYVNTTNAWVAGAEPLCAEGDLLKLLEEFAQAAARAGKRVLMLPVEQELVEKAGGAGFGAVFVGTEPVFLLDQYPPSGSGWLDMVPTAKTLSSKGAKVREFRPEELTDEQRAELDGLTETWLQSRKTATLGFLNQVQPWFRQERKKYFVVEHGEHDSKPLAFVAAIPFKGGRGWYLIDTIRGEGTPPGATELLILQAMQMLREQGAKEITLGISPLSGMEKVAHSRRGQNSLLYRVLKIVFEKGNLFYNFKPLFAYKMKFQPTLLRPAYLLYREVGRERSGLMLSDMVSLSQAWLPRGMIHATGLGAIRFVSRLSVPDLIKSALRPGTVVRSVPPNWLRLIFRCRFTVALLITAPVLIHSSLRLGLVVLGLTVFTGGLEYLAGSLIAVLCFGVPAVLSIPITGVGGFGLAWMGILGSAGGLYWFLRNGAVWLGVLALLSLGPSPEWIHLERWVAILLGIIIGKLLLRA